MIADRGAPTGRLHPGGWCLWLTAALAAAVVGRQPLFLALLVAVLGLAFAALAPGEAEDSGWGTFLRFGLLLVAFSAIAQPLLVHQGATTLVELPRWQWSVDLGGRPASLLDLGGRITLESLAAGVLRGLSLLAVLLAFAAFHRAVDPVEMVRRLPPFLHQSSVVLSVALNFIPQTLVAQREIRQAQALRGRSLGGLRGLGALFVALLAEGLERSIDLAEAMEARGFGGAVEEHPPRWTSAAIALALGLLLAAVAWRSWALPLSLAGGALLAAALTRIGRGVRRTRRRQRRWSVGDLRTVLPATACLAVVLFAREGLAYSPYPRFDLGNVPPWSALALPLLLVPALRR